MEDKVQAQGSKVQECGQRTPKLVYVRTRDYQLAHHQPHSQAQGTDDNFTITIKGHPKYQYLVLVKDKLVVKVQLEGICEARLLFVVVVVVVVMNKGTKEKGTECQSTTSLFVGPH